MYYLVNASPPKRLDVATSNFADAFVSSKADICDGVPSTEVKLNIVFVTFSFMGNLASQKNDVTVPKNYGIQPTDT